MILYSVVIVPKYRKKILFEQLRKYIGGILRDLFKQKGVDILEGHAMSDHMHICVSISSKRSISSIIGFVKGKSAIMIYRGYFFSRAN